MKDLFEVLHELPDDIREVVEEYCDQEMTYQVCSEFLDKCEQLGYTFNVGLDGTPYDLGKSKN